jgi:hypothetical protein
VQWTRQTEPSEPESLPSETDLLPFVSLLTFCPCLQAQFKNENTPASTSLIISRTCKNGDYTS